MKVVVYLFVGFVDGLGNPRQNFIWEDLEGKPVLLHIIDKLKMCKKITDVIPYTHLFPERDENKKAFEFAKKWGLELYSSKTDRWEDMLEFQKNIGVGENDIVILPINSPLIDPELIDSFVEKFKTLGLDYMWTEDFPGGIGVELWKGSIWNKFSTIDPEGEFLRTRGHHLFIKTSNLFKKDFIKAEGMYNEPTLQLQVDSSKQLILLRKIYKRFYEEKVIDLKDVIAFYKEEPEWFEIPVEEEIKYWEENIKELGFHPQYNELKANTHLQLGIIYFQQQKNEEAIKEFENVISLEPKDTNLRDSAILHNGCAYLNQQMYKEAMHQFDKVISLEPKDTKIRDSAIFHKGYAYWSQQKNEEAIKEFENVISLEPKDANIRNSAIRHKAIALSKIGILVINQLEIELTNDCSLKCIMCPRTSNMKREIGCMHFDVFKKIIDETDASSIHFSGLGEPLLHPQIKEMFTYAKEKGLEVGLWTSGLELTEELSEQIIEREFVDYIIFGLDAANKETYVKTKGVDALDKAVENITRFLKLKREKITGLEKDAPEWWGKVKPIVGVQILKMKETDAEIEEFMNKWDFQDKARKMINYRNRVEKEPRKVTVELWQTFYDKFLPVEHAIIGHFNNYCGQIEDRSAIDVTPLKRFPCKQLQSGISVLWNGDVVLCRQDFDGEHPLGNLKGKSLTEILESEELEDIWQAHKKGEYGKLPLCKDCKEWYYNLYA